MKLLLVAFAVAALSQCAPVFAEEFKGAELYEKCVKSCVFIVVPLKDGKSKEGSGSLIDVEKRLVITSYHVVGDNESAQLQFPIRNKDGSLVTEKIKYIKRIKDGEAIKGKVLFRDKTRDLALIELERLPADTPAIPLAKMSIKVGETVMTIGGAGKVRQAFSTTKAKVRAIEVFDFVVGGGDEVLRLKCRLVSTTNPTAPGDSGGPLIDKRGYQVAVCDNGYLLSGAQNVNISVDLTEVRAFLAEKKVTIKELSDEPNPEKKADPPAGAAPTAEDEKAATELLARAKPFAEGDDNRPRYIAKLKQVIAKYPGTEAAKEAKKKLDGLK